MHEYEKGSGLLMGKERVGKKTFHLLEVDCSEIQT